MNKYFLSLTILLLFNICNNTDIGNVIKLPEPKKQGGMPLFDALSIRHSSRDFNDSIKVTPEIISQALWSCYGFRKVILEQFHHQKVGILSQFIYF